MATQEVRAWTYTNGYPATLKPSKVSVPRANEVQSVGTTAHMLVRVHACGLNPVDIQTMNLPIWNVPTAKYRAEKVPVSDFSGVVLAGGRSGFQRGDEVFGFTGQTLGGRSGTLAEQVELNMAASVAAKKPAHWTHEQAAGMGVVFLTAKTSIERVAQWVDATSSKRVAVLGGSSSTGIYTIMLAKQRGWKVVTTSSGRNKDFVTGTLKADAHVDYTTQDVRQGVGAFQPDAVIDCVGGTECIGLPSSKRYISIVGDKTGRTSMGGPYTYYDYFAPVRAATQWLRWAKGECGLGESYDIIKLEPKKEWLEEATKTLGPDEIFTDSVFPFEEANKAFERLGTGRAKGKVIISIADSGERSKL